MAIDRKTSSQAALGEDVCCLSSAIRILCQSFTGRSPVVTEEHLKEAAAIQAGLESEIDSWTESEIKRLEAEQNTFTLSTYEQGPDNDKLQSLPKLQAKRVQRALHQHYVAARALVTEREALVKAEHRLEELLAGHAAWVKEVGAELAKHPLPNDDLRRLLSKHAKEVKADLKQRVGPTTISRAIPDAEERVLSVLDRDAHLLVRKNSDAQKPSTLQVVGKAARSVAEFMGLAALFVAPGPDPAPRTTPAPKPAPATRPAPAASPAPKVFLKGDIYRVGDGGVFATKAQVLAAGQNWDLDKRSSAQRSKGKK
jgi:hypothetical protein